MPLVVAVVRATNSGNLHEATDVGGDVESTRKDKILKPVSPTFSLFCFCSSLFGYSAKNIPYEGETNEIYFANFGTKKLIPLFRYKYKYLDNKFVGTAVKTVAKKMVAEQFLATPILLAAFYTLRRKDVFEELRAKYWKTLAANQAFWIPSQTVNFFFVPPYLRVVYVASVSFAWINVFCFIKRQKEENIAPIEN